MCLGDVGGGGEEERKGLCGHRGVWGGGGEEFELLE